MRDTFHKQLEDLKRHVESMAALARGMLVDGVGSLVELDRAKAAKVRQLGGQLADLDFRVEEEALMLVARQQPMARDLRWVAAALKLITYINRIGRYGRDCAQIAEAWPNQPHASSLDELRRMGEAVLAMFDQVMASYRSEKDLDIAGLTRLEQSVDKTRWRVWHETLAYMMQNPQHVERGANYMMIARYLERCGDNICKMAEKIHYAITGERATIR